ncbi:DNA repair protein RadA [Clostridium taeniosporum]|uniref:DNA repair protein RadA n=1 Tax=Clostridium taeniosporum TaxID=394958 RepID=A0A1D7XGA0_9CLOT|nr:DNA repair protein RadA [Clostridium taeniosporum]AOR22376.1 DNA repair protein RadA [Clostridium taeniosporum]
MAKIKSTYICQQCGYEAPKWLGKCPSCNNWNTFNEEIKEDNKTTTSLKVNSIVQNNQPKSIKDIKSGEKERYDTGIKELNRVLGGGLVKGSLTLISGDPGIGKSTLLLQTANNIAIKCGKVLYVSGEESEEQIKIRGDRLGANSENLFIISETNLDAISIYIEQINPNFVIIDSIQTIFKESVSSAPGSVSQVKECSNTIMRMCKGKNIPFFIVAHVTKQGELAGPRVLEHMVDTVLYFEGERTEEYRILRTMKNRFGTTSEIGVFEMQQEGLVEVFDPSKIFLEDTSFNQEGSVVVGVMEGTRPILIEIQALVSETKAPMPRRTAVGIDNQRLSLILAVLEKKLKVFFYNKDVYVNVVGGFNIDGTSADLGLALALISSAKSREFRLDKTLMVGEVGLTGEIRPISSAERLVKEAEKLGFSNVIIPERNLDKVKKEHINVIGIRHLIEAVNKIF